MATLPLFHAPGGAEGVAPERLDAGTQYAEVDCPGGEEIFILSGDLHDGSGTYAAGTWIRNPAGFRRSLGSTSGTTYWVKRGHLRPMA